MQTNISKSIGAVEVLNLQTLQSGSTFLACGAHLTEKSCEQQSGPRLPTEVYLSHRGLSWVVGSPRHVGNQQMRRKAKLQGFPSLRLPLGVTFEEHWAE